MLQIKNLDYKVIATGSKGNAVRIENVMIDCGISFKRMKDDLYKCDTLLLTHTHSDHIKPQTLMQIRREFPRIRVYGNVDVAAEFPVDKVIHTKPFDLKRSKIKVTPFDGVHDVQVTGYALQWHDGTSAIYMTDSAEVVNPIDDDLDYIFLESNFDEKKLAQIANQYKAKGYDPLESSLRHLSTQKCKAFYYGNRRSKDSKLIELHMSERFY